MPEPFCQRTGTQILKSHQVDRQWLTDQPAGKRYRGPSSRPSRPRVWRRPSRWLWPMRFAYRDDGSGGGRRTIGCDADSPSVATFRELTIQRGFAAGVSEQSASIRGTRSATITSYCARDPDPRSGDPARTAQLRVDETGAPTCWRQSSSDGPFSISGLRVSSERSCCKYDSRAHRTRSAVSPVAVRDDSAYGVQRSLTCALNARSEPGGCANTAGSPTSSHV